LRVQRPSVPQTKLVGQLPPLPPPQDLPMQRWSAPQDCQPAQSPSPLQPGTQLLVPPQEQVAVSQIMVPPSWLPAQSPSTLHGIGWTQIPHGGGWPGARHRWAGVEAQSWSERQALPGPPSPWPPAAPPAPPLPAPAAAPPVPWLPPVPPSSGTVTLPHAATQAVQSKSEILKRIHVLYPLALQRAAG
jgi:hypothetical protein